MSSKQDLFKQINNAILDIQGADFQSFATPLKRLARLLQHEDLEPFNEKLTAGLDFVKFLEESEASQDGMIGSAELAWPDDDQEILGLQLLLILKFADEPRNVADFGHTFFYTGSNKFISSIRAVVSQVIIPFARDYKAFVESEGIVKPSLIIPMTNKVFIVHGHDGEARETVARFLQNIGFTPVILNQEANQGRTIIEKIEAHSDVGFAVVLLTPDDLGQARTENDLQPRARQNVLLELGYFMALLGRSKVCVLRKGEVSVPSDFAGVVWEEMDSAGGWKLKLARELQVAGHTVNMANMLA